MHKKNECGFPSQSLQRFKSKALRIRMSHHQQQSRWKRFVAIVNSGIVVQPPSNITGEETWMALKTLTHRCIRLVYGVLQWYYYHYCQFELFTCPSAINLSIHPRSSNIRFETLSLFNSHMYLLYIATRPQSNAHLHSNCCSIATVAAASADGIKTAKSITLCTTTYDHRRPADQDRLIGINWFARHFRAFCTASPIDRSYKISSEAPSTWRSSKA